MCLAHTLHMAIYFDCACINRPKWHFFANLVLLPSSLNSGFNINRLVFVPQFREVEIFKVQDQPSNLFSEASLHLNYKFFSIWKQIAQFILRSVLISVILSLLAIILAPAIVDTAVVLTSLAHALQTTALFHVPINKSLQTTFFWELNSIAMVP